MSIFLRSYYYQVEVPLAEYQAFHTRGVGGGSSRLVRKA